LIAVNRAVTLIGNGADALYAGDHKWWAAYPDDWQGFQGMRFSINDRATREFGVTKVPQSPAPGLGDKGVTASNNSGFQAVGLAYLLGAVRIVLIGFDMKAAGRGRNHFHPDHQRNTRHNLTNPTPSLYRRWIRAFSGLHGQLRAQGVELVNATRSTALTIPRVSLEDEV
jgi:hypothetical protein